MSVRLYVEGGGDSKALRAACRRGFRRFIERAGLTGRMPRIVACGDRRNAYESFVTANDTGDGSPMLLVDAEAAVAVADPWEHLHGEDGWPRPSGATQEQCHLMVQLMESWLLADRPALSSFFGQGFKENALPGNQRIEDVAKADVLSGLHRATSGTQKKRYDKGSHSFEILALIDPSAVEAASPHAERFLEALRSAGST